MDTTKDSKATGASPAMPTPKEEVKPSAPSATNGGTSPAKTPAASAAKPGSSPRLTGAMTPAPAEKESFAEAAMKLGGKSEEEARRMGAVDRADDQVEAMFAARYQTTNSPI